ncbi:hypothetical protein TWF281_002112 [Arthrobotrys megalospora]
MVPSKLFRVALTVCLFGARALAGVYNYDGDHGYAAYARSKAFTGRSDASDIDAHTLIPVRSEHLFPELQKRSDDYSNLHLEDTATLYFGKHAGGYNINLATINAKPDARHPLIALEKFDSFTTSIACAGKDITLQFRDKEVMRYAVKKWDWVNRDDQEYFFLVSQHHHNGCNPKDERKPHKVTAVKSNERKLTVVLTLENASWDEALGDFTFNFETIEHPAVKLAKRRDPEEVGYSASPFSIILADFICARAKAAGIKMLGCNDKGDFSLGVGLSASAKAALEGVWNLIPNFDAKVETSITWGNDDINDRVQFADAAGVLPSVGGIEPTGQIQGNCIGCYIRGSFVYSASGGRDSKTGKTELIVAFQPRIKGRLKLELSGKVEVSKEFNAVADFVSKGLKGYVIKGIISLEPQFLSGPGVVLKAGGQGNFTVGFNMDFGSPTIMLKATSGGSVEVLKKDWGTFAVEPILHAGNIKTHSEVNPYFRLGVGIGATFFKNSTISGTLGVWAGLNPQMISTMDLGHDEKGMCGGKREVGAKFETKFRVDYSYTTVAKLETGSKLANFLFELVKPQSWAETRGAFNQNKKSMLYEKNFAVCKAFSF